MESYIDLEPGIEEAGNQESINQEQRMVKEFQSLQTVKVIPFQLGVKQFILPDYGPHKEYICALHDDDCTDRQLIFSALYTAAYRYFYTDDFSVFRKNEASQFYKPFLEFINGYSFDDQNRVIILKEFETSRVKNRVIKTQSSGLKVIIKCIKVALDYEPFYSALKDRELSYLYTLTKTKPAPDDDKSSYTLTQWFAQHSWLRREDVGIGHQLFTRLASPKALTNSFRITIETTLLEIQRAKKELMSFLDHSTLTPNDVVPFRKRDEGESHTMYYRKKQNHLVLILNRWSEKYHTVEQENTLELVIKLILHECVQPHSLGYATAKFTKNQRIACIRKERGKVYSVLMSNQQSVFFGQEFLYDLVCHLHSPTRTTDTVPVCFAEHYLFSSLMAIQTVQASDISKLTVQDFSLVKRRNGNVSHIHCEYFKGRAQTTHAVATLATNTDAGESILQFIQDRTHYDNACVPLTLPVKSYRNNPSGVLNRLFRFMQMELRDRIELKIEKAGETAVFLDALMALFENGEAYRTKKYQNVANYQELVEFKSTSYVWGFSAIKTSAVHAKSDSFTPTQLFNWHSHSDETERQSYRTPANLEWLNICGLITRAVMQDFATNLFRASEQDQREFNSEFTVACNSISSKSSDVLSRMKLITGKDHGHIDDLGFTKPSVPGCDDYPDTLYLLDSADTVLRLQHYLSEVKRKHALLVQNAPEYLFHTVLPTTEWIESLFAEKRFSSSSLTEGEALFHKYKKDLPPLFTPFTGVQ